MAALLIVMASPAGAASPDTDSPAPAAPTAPLPITPPHPLEDTAVAYPSGASGDASVELELLIGREGQVQSALVRAGEPPFAAAAQAAALGWRFEAARRGATRVAARIRFRVEFHQEPQAPAPAGAVPAGDPSPPAAAPPAPQPPAPIEVTVRATRPIGARTVSRAFARQLPGAFGNPFAAIESAPGVTPTLSGAPYFYVRGSPPGNLGYLLDDMRLPALFHVLAGPSVVHPALIESVDFYPGPYPARYGRFTGGIAAGQLRRATYELHGEASVRAFDSSGLVEVPLSDSTSATLAGRVSYANPLAHLFAPDVNVSYWDYQARFSHQATPRDEFSLFVFGSHDDLDRKDDDGRQRVVFGNEFHRMQIRYHRQLESGSVTIMAVGGSDRSALADGAVRLQAKLGQLRADVDQALSSSWRLQSGVDLDLDRYSLCIGALDNPADREDYVRRYPARADKTGGGYVSGQWRGSRDLSVSFGSRLDAYRSQGQTALAPGASVLAEFAMSPSVTLVHGLGVVHQPPSGSVPQPGANPALGQGLQHAVQSSAGLRVALPLDIRLEATLFQMALFNLSDSIGVSRIDNADESIKGTTRSTGSSRGLELQLERALSHDLGGYLSYTLSFSRRFVDRAEGPALFDRTHVLSGALSYRWGHGFQSGLRGTFYTGVPADVAYIAAARNPPRTTPFYRLDTRLEKRWPMGDQGAYWAFVLEVLNATLNKEALADSCNAYVCREDRVGPLTIPSLGLEASF